MPATKLEAPTMRPAQANFGAEVPMARLAGRRLIDVGMAACGLILLAPLLFLIACAIVAESRGPILFSQLRLGQGGRPFRIYKFRKFDESRAANGLAITLRRDSRMTRVGRLLQATKLDELPQLWNVLTGDMTIVGPRPESLAYADCFTDRWADLLKHTPGIFGPNQVIFRHEDGIFSATLDPDRFYRSIMFPLKAAIDLEYFDRHTYMTDTKCFIGALLAIFGVSPTRYLYLLRPPAQTRQPDLTRSVRSA
ncbi:sugar transferase [Methylobacterium durans]|uniref:sugar transferase n=1 Tax=Methylobacterium durans TaxID=2202825 RepID=UPI002AFEADFB|nr:sugar transferase [Methylobacterium durans]MEA1834417.1 sugar transferase [Methylobacterium durans]